MWRVTPDFVVRDSYAESFAPGFDMDSGFNEPDQVVTDFRAMTYTSFDASYWTPWGTFITAEESWSEPGTQGYPTRFGRLLELRNPLDAPAIYNPVTPLSNAGADFVYRNVIPRVSHEGIQFDQQGNMYFIDELNGGSIYKFTSAASWGQIM